MLRRGRDANQGELVVLKHTYFSDRWCSGRAVTAMDWSPKVCFSHALLLVLALPCELAINVHFFLFPILVAVPRVVGRVIQ